MQGCLKAGFCQGQAPNHVDQRYISFKVHSKRKATYYSWHFRQGPATIRSCKLILLGCFAAPWLMYQGLKMPILLHTELISQSVQILFFFLSVPNNLRRPIPKLLPGGQLQSSQEATWKMLVKRVVNGANGEDFWGGSSVLVEVHSLPLRPSRTHINRLSRPCASLLRKQ